MSTEQFEFPTPIKMSDEQPANVSTFVEYQNDDLDCGKTLYLNNEIADVHFSFGSNNDTTTLVPAHKILLAAKSDVFKAMFYGEMKEPGNVHMPDASEAAFTEFLQYFYLNDIKLCTEHIEGVLYLAQKYNVAKCVSDCVRFLLNSIDDDNVCRRLHLAMLYEQSELMKRCEAHILLYTISVFWSSGFLACDRQVMKHILTNNLITCSEVDVFRAMMSWVKAKSKQNKLSKELVDTHLGELFYEIRFAAMKIADFCKLAKKYNSVLSSHFETIVSNIIVLPRPRQGKFEKFHTNPSRAIWNTAAIITCDRTIADEPLIYELNTIERTPFSTNTPLIWGSFTCTKLPEHILDHSSVDVKIYKHAPYGHRFKSKRGNLLLEMTARLKTDCSTNIVLPHPILIAPSITYGIEIGPFPANERYTSFDAKGDVNLESDIHIEFDHRAKSGLITELDFNRIN